MKARNITEKEMADVGTGVVLMYLSGKIYLYSN